MGSIFTASSRRPGRYARYVLAICLLPLASAAQGGRELTLDERVAFQWAIEEVNWQYRIWPKENLQPKPPLEEVMTPSAVRAKVEAGLRKSQALEFVWGRPITPAQLQREMERMARDTQQPDRLRALFAALGNDPWVIAECLARPSLADRLIRNWSAGDEQRPGESQPIPGKARLGIPVEKSFDYRYEMPEIRGGGAACLFDTWKATAGPPEPREGHSAVWTGAEMIVWGGSSVFISGSETNTGGRYDPATDTWAPTARTGAPRARFGHTAVWTGTEMIVWGGAFIPNFLETLNSGGHYNPATDTWTPTEVKDAPMARTQHTAVWTGTEMIVWGGRSMHVTFSTIDSGGRYNPAEGTWVATNRSGAPSARSDHTAVWTETEMIVWGGHRGMGADGDVFYNTGGRYNPTTDTWTATPEAGAPSARIAHTAVWTGQEMLIWGGNFLGIFLNTGGRYDPTAGTWLPISKTESPMTRGGGHTAVWTGTEMIIWGGLSPRSGGRYDPVSDTWVAVSEIAAPTRSFHTAVWTGTEMIVWGGRSPSASLNTGGRYDPKQDAWVATSGAEVPVARSRHSAVWTGAEMIVWGGYGGSSYLNSGGRYDPAIDTWTVTNAAGAPSPRGDHTAVWTGTEMIVWGGGPSPSVNTGGRYNPATDTWLATSELDTPSPRFRHKAVWTGTEMMVWGGTDFIVAFNTGARYDPGKDLWIPMSRADAPSARSAHTAVWTGKEMIVWGGFGAATPPYLNTGGRYSPSTDSWEATSEANAPRARSFHTAVWTGKEMIVWGGFNDGMPPIYLNTGGRYDAATDTWTPTSETDSPTGRFLHTAVWTETEMVVWGGAGQCCPASRDSGGRYDPTKDRWVATSVAEAPSPRSEHTAVWTGMEMIVWGGSTTNGGRYCAYSADP